MAIIEETPTILSPTRQNGPWPVNFSELKNHSRDFWTNNKEWKENLADCLEKLNIPQSYAQAECAYANTRTIFATFREQGVEFEMLDFEGTFYTLYKRKKDKEGMAFDFKQGAMTFAWNNVKYYLVKMLFVDYNYEEAITFVYAPELNDILRFCNWLEKLSQNTDDKILIYNKTWEPSSELMNEIASASWDKIVLDANDKAEIRGNINDFFSERSKEIYEQLNMSWRRGLLFVGPPGTGKTKASKAAANDVRNIAKIIYVLNADNPQSGLKGGLQDIYDKAKESAPCLVVLEDVDTLITEHVKSFFLQLLDGFSPSSGVLTIATTNHPETLDAALTERPSRFDRKYMFPTPTDTLRRTYMNEILLTQLTQAELDSADIQNAVEYIINNSKNFSYASLQEVYLTAFYPYLINNRTGNLAQGLKDAVDIMKKQHKKTSMSMANEVAGRPDDQKLGFSSR